MEVPDNVCKRTLEVGGPLQHKLVYSVDVHQEGFVMFGLGHARSDRRVQRGVQVDPAVPVVGMDDKVVDEAQQLIVFDNSDCQEANILMFKHQEVPLNVVTKDVDRSK
jgi:hypothetical protein